MKTIEFKTPFDIGGVQVTKAKISNPTFEVFTKLVLDVSAQKSDRPFAGRFNTASIVERVTLVFATGKEQKLEFVTASTLPPHAGKQLITELNDDRGGGKILSAKEADGVARPIHYELQHPIAAADGKGITELEFMAKTYGDLESVLGETNNMDQTMALLRHVAKPIGMLAMPTWAVSSVSVQDGLYIRDNILPRFLE